MSDDTKSSVRFKPELGEHKIREAIESDSVSNTYEFEVEAETVFKRLAEDIYNGKEAGIREPLTNGITAVFRAIEEGYIDDASEGIILFELYESDDTKRLKIRDNGVGMTRDEIDEVVSVIGTSTSRSSSNLTGKFGMGFLATWMLAGGVEGGFIMHTNPRGVDEEPISGIWNSNSFSEMSDGELEGGLESDDYGTEFDIMVSLNIEISELIQWINKYSEWSRIPILFRHYTDDGLTDEEFTPKHILDMYKDIEDNEENVEKYNVKISNDELKYYTIENEHFTAVNSNLREGGYRSIRNVILLDVPVKNAGELNNTTAYPLGSLEIRIDTEIPVVVDGPHKGKYVVSNSESNQLGDEFISEDLITTSDIVTPAPTGTRDMLQESEQFTEWLTSKFYDIHYDNIAGLLREVDTINDYISLSKKDIDEFHNLIINLNDSNYMLSKSDIHIVESRANTTFDKDLRDKLPALHSDKVSLAEEGVQGISKMKNRTSIDLRDIFLKSNDTNGDVYMGHRITQEKAEFIWDSEKDHHVIRVENDKQDEYKKSFGWKTLSEIDFENSLQMEDEKRDKYINDEVEPSDKDVKLHIGSYNKITDIKASELKNIISEQKEISIPENNFKHNISKLIVFKRGETSVSQNKKMVGNVIGTASVSSDVHEYLIDAPNVWDGKKAINMDIVIPASDGNKYNINEDISKKMITHIVDEETIEDFRQPEFMKKVEEYIHQEICMNGIYLPMTIFEYQFGFNKNGLVHSDRRKKNISTQGIKESVTFPHKMNDVELYLNATVDKDTAMTDALKTVKKKWSNGGKEIIEMFENSNT